MDELFSIAQASLESGIAKEVLRKWEVRYGFPVPTRDTLGNRVYTAAQLSRLKLIRKLLDDGFRPAKIVAMEEAALLALAASPPINAALPQDDRQDGVVDWLRARDPALLRENLQHALATAGLASFVREVMPAMNVLVGQAWEQGSIAVRDEHVYSEIIQTLLREALAPLLAPQGRPRILLTTPPGESHVLGLLMLEVVMSLEGACCISLGAQSPLDEIISAAADFRADIVALSFSVAFPRKKIAPVLKEIRSGLSADVKIWAGGAGAAMLERTPRGISVIGSLSAAVQALAHYRAQYPAPLQAP